jgi:NhaC family Na+:H+ antiporter
LSSITSAIFILLAVGALIGTWNLSGTIPTLVYYGIQVLAPGYYYVAAAVMCGVVALSIGSSWTTAGTIGVGLVGIAALLGVSGPITAGAVISGAYLGDKLSPLSETTILSALMVEVDLFTHIRSQIWTSVPAFLLAGVVFAVLGVAGPAPIPTAGETVELAKLDQIYWITPWNLLPLLLVFLSIRKVPASLALLASALFAGVTATLLQRDVVRGFVHLIDGSTNAVLHGRGARGRDPLVSAVRALQHLQSRSQRALRHHRLQSPEDLSHRADRGYRGYRVSIEKPRGLG